MRSILKTGFAIAVLGYAVAAHADTTFNVTGEFASSCDGGECDGGSLSGTITIDTVSGTVTA